MELRRPRLSDKEAILDMIAEFEEAASYMHGGMASTWKRAEDYEDWLDMLEKQESTANLPDSWVPAIQFLSFDEENRPLGCLSLRLQVNEKTLIEGGHIGYAIRPSKRRQGFATRQLALSLAEATKVGLGRVLITCDVDNEGSRRTILSCGGVYENTIDRNERYWIELEGKDEQSQTTGVESRGAQSGPHY